MARFKEKNVGISFTTGLITLPSPLHICGFFKLLSTESSKTVAKGSERFIFSSVYSVEPEVNTGKFHGDTNLNTTELCVGPCTE